MNTQMKLLENEYGVKLSLISSVMICLICFTFAEPLSHIFTYSANSAILSQRITEAIRILCFFVLLMPFGIIAGNLFQSMGKGTIALFFTFLRALLLEIIFAGLFGFVLGFKDVGIYAGLVCGMSVGSILSYLYLNYYLKKLRKYFN